MSLLIDAHLDLAYNAIGLGRDLNVSVAAGRQRAAEQSAAWRRDNGTLTTTLPEIAAHMPTVVCGTIFIVPASAGTPFDQRAYSTPAEARAQALEQLRWYQDQVASGHLRLVASSSDLDAACAASSGPPGLVLLMEGADGLVDPSELAEWHAAGLRWLGPAWQATRYSGGTGAPGPLTALGRELITAMNQLGVALDVSHLAEASFWEALELIETPVAASHANCRALSEPRDRYLSDAMIKAVVERDGVIGIVPCNPMLVPQWDGVKASVGLDAVVRHIDHICTLAGSTRHVGLGSDFDGGFGSETIPAGLERWGDLPQIGAALASDGWSDADIRAVLGGNWRRWLAQALG